MNDQIEIITTEDQSPAVPVDHDPVKFPLESNGKYYYEDTNAAGDLLRVYESGTIYNYTQKQLERGFINENNARAMQAARYDSDERKRKQAAILGALAEISADDRTAVKQDQELMALLYELGPAYVVQAVAASRMARLMLDSASHTAVKAADLLLKQTGTHPEKGQGDRLIASKDGLTVILEGEMALKAAEQMNLRLPEPAKQDQDPPE